MSLSCNKMISIVCTASRRISKRLETNYRSYAKLAATRKTIDFPQRYFSDGYRKFTFDSPRIGGNRTGSNTILKAAAAVAFVSGSLFIVRCYYDDVRGYFRSIISVSAAKKKKETAQAKPHLTSRELRFLNYASVEFEGQIFMTPRDFLDSVTQVQPKDGQKRRKLTEEDVSKMLKHTPPFGEGSSKDLFRQLGNNGLISYTEYLFLLCVLTKPTTGFRIAFNMFDTDGNQKVDKKEFLVVQALTLMHRAGGKLAEFDPYLDLMPPRGVLQLVSDTSLPLRRAVREQLEKGAGALDLETVFARSRRQKKEQELEQYEATAGARLASTAHSDDDDDAEESSQSKTQPQDSDSSSEMQHTVWEKTEQMADTMHVQDTTLLVHFFGFKGDRTVTYDDFYRFTEDLQTEALELEFTEFSHGKSIITEADFATLLLRYTVTRPETYKAYMDRVKEKIPDPKGITFAQFRQFCRFLTCLDDFTIAVKLYTFADLPVSQAEFARAVKVSTGHSLDPHIVDTVFQIFDVNNDGRLSYSEFIGVMRDRLRRGFKTHVVKKHGWDAYKQCIRAEMKRY